MIIVRFADDFIMGFEHEDDAQRLLADLRQRLAKFGLALHPDKTRLVEFGRHAARNRAARGLGKPETFDFLGFTHICGKTRDRALRVAALHDLEAVAGQAPRGQDGAAQTPAPTRPRAGPMAGQRGARSPRLLRRARQQPGGERLPDSGDTALVSGASASQPAHPPDLGTDEPPRQTMATTRPHHASLAQRALRRPHPR